MKLFVCIANVVCWPFIHLCAAYVAARIPDRYFARDCWITVARNWERNGGFYRSWLRIRSWKSILPDGAPWVGGFSKKKIRRRDRDYLQRFLLETRRSEIAHWCMLTSTPVFFLWNPQWACWLMVIYAVAANIPCILAQRYNRLSLNRIVKRTGPVWVAAVALPVSEANA